MLLLKFIIYAMVVILFLVFLVSMINSTSKTLSIEDRKTDLLVGVVSFVFLCLLLLLFWEVLV